jgi:hypothetical protein
VRNQVCPWLSSDCPLALFLPAWESIAHRVKESKDLNPLLVSTILKSLRGSFSSKVTLEALVNSLTKEIVRQSVEDIHQGLTINELDVAEISGLSFLVNMLSTLREQLFVDPDIIEVRACLSLRKSIRIAFTGR